MIAVTRRVVCYGLLVAVGMLFIIQFKRTHIFHGKDFPWTRTALVDLKLTELEVRAPIYFVETSSKTQLELREICAVEAASRHNPQRNVTFLSIKELDLHDETLKPLLERPNIHFSLLNLSGIFAGTPFAVWYKLGAIATSSYPVELLSDALRLVLLWKLGGIYLDTDVICLRSFSHKQRNALGLEQANIANGAVLIFDRGHDFLYRGMLGYVTNFSATEWGTQGPKLLTRILHATCRENDLAAVIRNPDLCGGVTILPETDFYPIPWGNWGMLFENGTLPVSYTVHLWSKLSRSTKTRAGSGNRIDVLFRENCPSTYELMNKIVVV